jgi:hypothetical protein
MAITIKQLMLTFQIEEEISITRNATTEEYVIDKKNYYILLRFFQIKLSCMIVLYAESTTNC